MKQPIAPERDSPLLARRLRDARPDPLRTPSRPLSLAAPALLTGARPSDVAVIDGPFAETKEWGAFATPSGQARRRESNVVPVAR